jgi:hypothetical protein
LSSYATVYADDLRVAPCRPTLACTADLVPSGTLELELGYQLRRTDDSAIYQHSTPVLIKLPLASWIEAQLGTNGYTITPTAHYLDNITTGAKLHLVDQAGQRPSLALTVTASVPTASQQGYTRAYDLFASGHASNDYGKLHLDWLVGLNAWQLDGPVSYQGWTALAATYPLTDRLSAMLEPHYFTDAAPIAPRDAGVMAAVAYAIRPSLVIDTAVNVVLANEGSVTWLLGISLAPVRLWGEH